MYVPATTSEMILHNIDSEASRVVVKGTTNSSTNGKGSNCERSYSQPIPYQYNLVIGLFCHW